MNKIIVAAAFGLGAVLGSAITARLVDNHYAELAQKEIDAVKEVYQRKLDAIREKEDLENEDGSVNRASEYHIEPQVEIGIEEVAEKSEDFGYLEDDDEPTRLPEVTDWTGEEHWERDLMPEPYIIDKSEFATLPDYAVIPLTYYADKILADDQGIIIEDVDRIVGADAVSKLPSENAVYVRNDMIKCDYEITEDERDYVEYVAAKEGKERDK